MTDWTTAISIRFAGAALALMSAGCSFAPIHERPAAPVAAQWQQDGPASPQAGDPAVAPAAELGWRDYYAEPALQHLIALALENNRDLRIAALNIERSRALYQIRRADLLPQIDAIGEGSGRRVPADLGGNGGAETIHQYRADLAISAYELDVFGRVRSLNEQALQQYLATEEARRSVQISLVSEVAANYLTLAADRERLALARETLANYQFSYELSRSRFEAGIASALDFNQAKAAVETARAEIARYTTLAAQGENALNLVVGTAVPVELLPKTLTETLTALEEFSPQLPSEVLLQRPDIMQAENLLKGYNANIGAARAAFFPRIILVSTIGTGSSELSGLFEDGSLVWSFAPRVTLPIFDAGRNQANLKVAEVDRDIAVARYEQAIQTAFREVADALARRGTIDEQLAALQALTDANAESYRLSQARFEKGVDNYLAVLVSQRFLYGAQQNLISTRLARLDNQVTLYKVLGGGGQVQQ